LLVNLIEREKLLLLLVTIKMKYQSFATF